MSKKISERTSGISLAGFESRLKVFDGQTPANLETASSAPLPVRELVAPFTGAGMFMNSITGKEEVEKALADSVAELEDANKKIQEYASATLVRKLDPKLVRRSHWSNRNEAEFSTADFEELKTDIESSGGNVQPIKVRMVEVFDGQTPAESNVFDRQTPYEIVFGHRRHQACLLLGLPVSAVIEEQMSDLQLFEEMDRENRARKSLSAWEQGRMYRNALEKGLYPSLRKLSESLNVNLADASRSIDLAKLPEVIVGAFQSPLDIQIRWSKPLKDALQKNLAGMLAIAEAISTGKEKLSPVEIFERLIGKDVLIAQTVIEIKVHDKKVATFRIDARGKGILEFETGVLLEERQKSLISLVQNFLID